MSRCIDKEASSQQPSRELPGRAKQSAEHAAILQPACTTAAVLLFHVGHQLHWVREGLAAMRAALVAAAVAAARRTLLPNVAAAPAPRMRSLCVLNQLLHSGEAGATLLAALRPSTAGWRQSSGPPAGRRRARQVNHVRRLPVALLLLLLPVLLELRLYASSGLRRCSSCPASCSGPAGRLPRRTAGLLPRRAAASRCTAAAASTAATKQAAKATKP